MAPGAPNLSDFSADSSVAPNAWKASLRQLSHFLSGHTLLGSCPPARFPDIIRFGRRPPGVVCPRLLRTAVAVVGQSASPYEAAGRRRLPLSPPDFSDDPSKGTVLAGFSLTTLWLWEHHLSVLGLEVCRSGFTAQRLPPLTQSTHRVQQLVLGPVRSVNYHGHRCSMHTFLLSRLPYVLIWMQYIPTTYWGITSSHP